MFANKLANPQTRSTSESIWVVLIELQANTLPCLVHPRDATFKFQLLPFQLEPYKLSPQDTNPFGQVLITDL